MENDLRATDRISKGIQRSIALEYPIISYIRLQQLTIIGKTKSAILKNEKYIFWCFPAISGASV